MNTAANSPGIGATEERQLREVVEGLERLYRRQLVAVFLYGSAARGEFIPGRSDLNLLIVLQSLGVDDLAAAAKLFHRWKTLRITPLLLTAGEVRLASRVFPLELSDIKEFGRLLYGSNPLAAIQVEPDHVRAQCKRELHARLIRLRQEYLELGDRRNTLARILAGSLTSLLPVFRAVLRLGGYPVPSTDATVVDAIVARHHLDPDLFVTLLAHKQGSRPLATADLNRLLGRLIVEWERVIGLVDAA
jgi:predicted nucleotidyltransferase